MAKPPDGIPADVLKQAAAIGQATPTEAKPQALAPNETLQYTAPSKADLLREAAGKKLPENTAKAGQQLARGGVTQQGELPKEQLGNLRSQKQHELAPKPTGGLSAAQRYAGRSSPTPAAQPEVSQAKPPPAPQPSAAQKYAGRTEQQPQAKTPTPPGPEMGK